MERIPEKWSVSMHPTDSAVCRGSRSFARTLSARIGAACLAIALSLTLACSTFAGPAELLEEARGHFDFGEYQKARDLTARAIAAGTLGRAELRSAHVLAGQCELELANVTAAQTAFCAAWKADPAWDPSKEDYRQAERDAIERARLDCANADPVQSTDRDSERGSPERSQPDSTPQQQSQDTQRATPDLKPSGQRTDQEPLPSGQAEIGRKAWYQRPIAWVGGLALAAGAIVLMGGGGGGNDDPGDGGTPPLDDFPAPPDPPGNPSP